MSTTTSPVLHETTVGADEAETRVLFLHGLFGRGKNLQRIAQGLQPDAQSVMLDLPNHGASSWTDAFDYCVYADTVAEHIRGRFASAGPVDVVGHSMGGKVAMVLALRHPDLVNKLAVIDIAPVASGSARGQFAHLLGSLAELNLATVHRRSDADLALAEAIPQQGVRGFLLQNLRKHDETFSWEPNLELLRKELDTIMGFPDLSGTSFSGPVLWLKGARSDYITDADATVMRALFPRTHRVTVRDAGHWVHSEKPAEVIAILRRFLIDA